MLEARLCTEERVGGRSRKKRRTCVITSPIHHNMPTKANTMKTIIRRKGLYRGRGHIESILLMSVVMVIRRFRDNNNH